KRPAPPRWGPAGRRQTTGSLSATPSACPASRPRSWGCSTSGSWSRTAVGPARSSRSRREKPRTWRRRGEIWRQGGARISARWSEAAEAAVRSVELSNRRRRERSGAPRRVLLAQEPGEAVWIVGLDAVHTERQSPRISFRVVGRTHDVHVNLHAGGVCLVHQLPGPFANVPVQRRRRAARLELGDSAGFAIGGGQARHDRESGRELLPLFEGLRLVVDQDALFHAVGLERLEGRGGVGILLVEIEVD